MSDVSDGSQNKLRESISALIDGETDELELRRVLASGEAEDVRGAWRDYHLQRDVLAGVDMRFAHLDISRQVQAALVDEALPAAVGSRWWRPLASVAVAASVATVVVIGARGLNSTGNDAAVAQSAVSAAGVFPVFSEPASSRVSNVAVGAALASSPAIAQPVALDPDQFARQRLQQYLLRHTERAALNNGQGVISFSKVSELSNEP